MAVTKQWAKEEVGRANFGDKRLNKRFGNVLTLLTENPSGSIPQACHNWKETVGTYRFFNHEEVCVAKILEPHQEMTISRIQHEPIVLIIQDTTEINFSHRSPMKGMGPLRTESNQGFFLHASIAVTPERVCLGVVDGSMWARDKLTPLENRVNQPLEEKESNRWLLGYESANEIAKCCEQTRIINIADREADIYELLMQNTAQGYERKADWIVRSRYDRNVTLTESRIKAKLRQTINQTAVKGEIEFILPRGRSRDKNQIWSGSRPRKKHTVKQVIRFGQVTLSPAERRGKKLPSINVHAVSCIEIGPPSEEEKIEWLLLTNIPITNVDEAMNIVQWYLCRWQVEMFFKVLKSGCRVEELQFDSFENTTNCVAVYMIVAWRVLYLMMLSRHCAELSCELFFEESEWKSAYVMVKKTQPPPKPPTINEMIKIVAELGGFLGRKGDGIPGSKTIWIGLQRLRDFSAAWVAFHQLKEPATYV